MQSQENAYSRTVFCRRCFVAAGALALCFLMPAACGSPGAGATDTRNAEFTMDVANAGERLFHELEFRDRLEELDSPVVCAILGIDGEDAVAQKNYFSSGATAEEIIVFQARDSETLAILRSALEARLEYQKEIYAAYAPEEVRYLQGAVLREKGVYLIYCVAADAEKAEELTEKLFTERE